MTYMLIYIGHDHINSMICWFMMIYDGLYGDDLCGFMLITMITWWFTGSLGFLARWGWTFRAKFLFTLFCFKDWYLASDDSFSWRKLPHTSWRGSTQRLAALLLLGSGWKKPADSWHSQTVPVALVEASHTQLRTKLNDGRSKAHWAQPNWESDGQEKTCQSPYWKRSLLHCYMWEDGFNDASTHISVSHTHLG